VARSDPELDRIYSELALVPAEMPSASRALAGMRNVVRAYYVLGAVVTALGLLAVFEEWMGFGDVGVTVWAILVLVVLWAASVPFVLRRASSATESVLGPLGLRQYGATMSGERHGRKVSVRITGKGSAVTVEASSGPIVIERKGHARGAWLYDLAEAERRADEAA
jgi:hypothetical protein